MERKVYEFLSRIGVVCGESRGGANPKVDINFITTISRGAACGAVMSRTLIILLPAFRKASLSLDAGSVFPIGQARSGRLPAWPGLTYGDAEEAWPIGRRLLEA